MMRTWTLAAAGLLVAASAALAQPGGPNDGHNGSRPRDVEVAVLDVQAADTAAVVATWVSRNNFSEEFIWRVDAFGRQDTTATLRAELLVAQTGEDQSATFCVRARRLSDGRESTEVCAGFVVPKADIVLPPDSLKVQVSSIGSNWVTARWDTLASAAEYFVSLETPAGQEVGRFPFASRSMTRTASARARTGRRAC